MPQATEGHWIEVTLLASALDPHCPPAYLGAPLRIVLPVNGVELPEARQIPFV